jgi:hypothetical protein
MANETTEKPAEKGLTKKTEGATGAILGKKDTEIQERDFFKAVGFDQDDIAGFQRTATGGVTKWVDMRAFMVDPNVPQNKPVKGNGKGFAGTLLGKGSMEVDEEEGGEEVTDEITGEVRRMRYFYSIRLAAPCPVTFKDENGEDQSSVAAVGDVVCIGERFQFRKWRDMVADGGEYLVAVMPDSRIKIKGGKRTMWTFNVWEKTLRPAMRVRAELVHTPGRQ